MYNNCKQENKRLHYAYHIFTSANTHCYNDDSTITKVIQLYHVRSKRTYRLYRLCSTRHGDAIMIALTVIIAIMITILLFDNFDSILNRTERQILLIFLTIASVINIANVAVLVKYGVS
ncbi:hypothetical protein VPHF86_0200 [Vibrio phage F86]